MRTPEVGATTRRGEVDSRFPEVREEAKSSRTEKILMRWKKAWIKKPALQ